MSYAFVVRTALAAALFLTQTALADTAVETYGNLSVKNGQIVDAAGNAVALAGPSLFWSNTGWNADRFYNAAVINYVQENWNASLIRAAIGAGMNGGYLTHPEENRSHAEAVIEAAIDQGMYVILDWHAHHAEKHPEKAIEFFTYFAKKYGNTPNIIYEIYNEPLADTDWASVIKPYSEKLIKAIRDIDPDNLIIIGTQTWSQDVDKAADNPVTGYENLAYTLHFYAGTHKADLRKKAQYALDKGLALMVTEWGTVNANGDGGVDHESTEAWVEFMRSNHLSHANWALNDKDEGASILKPGTPADGNWSDDHLTESGLTAKSIVKNWSSIDYDGD